jgi:hypothetical protein
MCGATRDVRFGPIADIEARSLRVRLTLPKADIDGLRGPLTERFSLRQELCRIPSIVTLRPFSSLVGFPMTTARLETYFDYHADR